MPDPRHRSIPMPSCTKIQFGTGDELAGVRILRPLGEPGELQMFEVRYLCCGRLGTISRPILRKRINQGSTLCRKCASRASGFQMGASNKGKRKPQLKPTPATGATDRNGQFWPALGRMGPRWGLGDASSRIGTGGDG